MKVGDRVFWRWKSKGTSYSDNVITGINNGLLTFSSKYSDYKFWLDIKELDIIPTDPERNKE